MRPYPLFALTILILLGSPLAARGDEVLKPTKAQTALRNDLKELPDSERDAEERRRSIEYLAQWKASGQKPTSADHYALAQFLQSAGRYKEAAEGFAGVQKDEGAKEKTRDYAATAEALLLLIPELRTELGAAGLGKIEARLEAYAEEMAASPARSKGRVKVLSVLASAYVLDGNTKGALATRMKIAKEDPKSIDDLVRPIVRGLLASTHSMGGYDELRSRAKSILGEIRAVQQREVDTAKGKLDAALAKVRATSPDALGDDGRLEKTSTKEMSAEERALYTAQRSYDTAAGVLKLVDDQGKPFQMLGKPAPEWTLEKAYGDLSTLAETKGKVVVLDFWATWPDVCNFPVMRDLMRDYAGKGLTVVGVTTTASVVYASRFDADEDLKSKHTGGRLSYAARLATADAPADEAEAIFDAAAYREHEHEAITTFIQNHELKWPVVMVAKDDPGSKYALEGWPHIVVLDKQGRIRVIMGGGLARSETQAVAGLRAAVEALLAE